MSLAVRGDVPISSTAAVRVVKWRVAFSSLGAVTLKDRASEPVRLRSTWATDSAAPIIEHRGINHIEEERGGGASDEHPLNTRKMREEGGR